MSKVWLVTGSASGLGRNIAEAVLACGDRLVATARDPHRLEDLVKKYGDQVRTAPLDVADEEVAKAAVQGAVGVFGRLDVVVNNAGYGDVAPFEQLSSERFKAVVDTNFYGVVNVTRAALPIMRKQRSGCILQVSSLGGRLALPGSTAYHAAKWAVGGFTESLAQEVVPFGIRVCALEPGGMSWAVRNRFRARCGAGGFCCLRASLRGGGWRAGSCGWGRRRCTCEHITIIIITCQAQICLLHGNIFTAPNLASDQMNQRLISEFEQIFSRTPV